MNEQAFTRMIVLARVMLVVFVAMIKKIIVALAVVNIMMTG